MRELTLTDARPLVVALDDAGRAAVLTELAGAGWTVTDAPAPAPACRTHPVRTRADAQAVVVAALRGEAVLAVVSTEPGLRSDLATIVDDLVEDLAGIGDVLQVDAGNAVELDVETWRLAHEIARGTTLDTAARLLNMSTRTANRRLGAARRTLGADSRAQLVRALRSPDRVPPAVTVR